MTAEAFPELYGNYMMELRLPLPPDDMLGWIAQSDVSSCELCVLRRPVATSAFASGHPALPVAGVNQPLFVQS